VIAYNICTDIPKSAFQFEFPVGTYVSDLRMADIYSRSYIVRQGGKKRIITKEELRRGAGADYKELLSTESGMARGKSGDQSGNPSAAKPADAVSPASDQSATKEGAKGESKPAPAHGLAEPNADRTAEIGEASTDTTKHDDPPKATKHLPLVRVFDYMLSHYSNTTINNKRIEKELIGQVYSDIVKVEDVKEFELEHDPDQYLYVEARLPENRYNGCKVGLIFDKKSTKAEVYKAAAELPKGARISIAAKLYKLIFSAASNDEAALGTLASKNEARFTGVERLEIVSDQRGQKTDVQVIVEEKAAVSHAAAKPADAVSPASNQSTTKEGPKTAQAERVKILNALVEMLSSQYKSGNVDLAQVCSAENELCNALLDSTDDPEKRVALLTKQLDKANSLLKSTQALFDHGIPGGTEIDLLRAKLLCQDIKTKLLREGSGKRLAKPIPRHQIEPARIKGRENQEQPPEAP